MISCTRRLQFAAGHRVYGHESKCANIHGHNYVVFIHARASTLDAIGRVIDFSVLKKEFGVWIDANWDHGMLLSMHDPIVHLYEDAEQLLGLKWFQCTFNPTAENMAKHLLDIAPSLMEGTGVEVWRITLWETENCFAEATLDGL